MLRLHIDAADKEIKRMLDSIAHIQGGAAVVCARAINRTLQTARAEAVRLAGQTYTVRAGDLRRRSDLVRAAANRLAGRLHITGKQGLGLINFQARPNKPGSRPKEGASVKVLRSGPRKRPRADGKKAFVARGKSGNVHLFVRTGPGRKDLRALYGPHPILALGRSDVLRDLEEKAREALAVNLRHEMNYLLLHGGKGGRK